MQHFAARILVGSTIMFCVLEMAPVLAQDANERTIEQYACGNILRESGSSRDVAIAFLHGFLLGKSGAAKFDLETLKKQTDAFLDRCLENTRGKAVDAMLKVKT